MLLKQATLRAVEQGRVTLAFRRWRRPTVKAGGTLLTAIGQLAIDAVDAVDLDQITEADARAAGTHLEELRAALTRRSEGTIYRITLRLAGPDPRVALREEIPDQAELSRIMEKLGGLDRRSPAGPWTRPVLGLLDRRPGVRAEDLASSLGWERLPFKANVRKLKGLGLTESLKVGYRLSPRGRAVLVHIEADSDVD